MVPPENMHPRTFWSSWIHASSFARFELRDISCLFLVAANILWFWEPLTLVFTSSLQDEHSKHYSHIVLIPILCLYMLYLRREAIFATVEWSPFLGSILIVAGGAVLLAAQEPRSDTVNSFSSAILAFVMMCWGAFLFCYGIQAFRAATFGLGLMVFIIPFPDFVLNTIVRFLQRGSADAVDLLFSTLGIPVFREEFIFTLSDFTILIAEECSGIRSFLSLVIISLVAGHWFLTSGWTKAALVVVLIPMAIIKNAFRIVGLALLANYVDPTFITDSALHRSSGIPLFLISLVVLFGIVLIFRRWEVRLAVLDGSVRDGHA